MTKSSKSAATRSKPGKPSTKRRTAATGATTSKAASKHDLILDLLRRKQGASLADLQKASGWQAHSVRGFLAGTVKKRLGLKLTSDKSKDGERRYGITSV
jgi:hypothetical protein